MGIDWQSLIEPNDLEHFPRSVSRIYLGTAFKELRDSGRWMAAHDEIHRLVGWADLTIPHPRDDSIAPTHPLVRKYPAESLIAHYSSIGKVEVLHHNSSAALSFSENPRVHLVDLDSAEAPVAYLHEERHPAPIHVDGQGNAGGCT